MGICLSQELVERYVDGSCTQNEQQAIGTHLARCEKCRKRVETARSNMNASEQSEPVSAQNDNIENVSGQKPIKQDEYPTKSMPEFPNLLSAGDTLSETIELKFEDYKILDKIGEGGTGTVWRALQLSTQRQVALKVLGTGTFATKKGPHPF